MVLEQSLVVLCYRLLNRTSIGIRGGGSFLKTYVTIPGFKYTVILRYIQTLQKSKLLLPLVLLLKIKLVLMQHKYGIQIPWYTKIGKGFYIGHFGEIVVNGGSIIGENVNISQGVTIGQVNRGKYQGVPTIGNGVYIGPGAKVIGKISIGSNVAIGANAVVTTDVPDNACVAGVPARVISMDGADGYVNRTV